MALAERERRFHEFCRSFEHAKPCSLIAVYRPSKQVLEKLRFAASVFAASCLPDQTDIRELIADEKGLSEEFSRQLPRIKNVTPNGMIVPKKELTLEYNLFARAFMELIDSMGIASKIEAWVNPPNLRFKDGLLDLKLLERAYASEHIHSEAWIPINTKHCYSIFVPLLGDAAGNRVEFFAPPSDFEESWLEPLPTYKSGEEIAKRFKKVEGVAYEPGEVYVAEVATLHASARRGGSGPRLSIDLNFIPKQPDLPASAAQMDKQSTLSTLGKEKIFAFKDSIHQIFDTQGATKHPAQNRVLVDLPTA